MPLRKTPLVKDHYYHLINKGVAGMPIFRSRRDFVRMMEIIDYYQFKDTPLSFSKIKKLSIAKRKNVLDSLERKARFLVEIICFCLMPNHFHFLLRQIEKDGIMLFLKNIQGSYGKYFNVKYERVGPVFQNRFKAILVDDDRHLLHLSRYIHLNPYSSLVIKKKEDLLHYPWSSLPQYLEMREGFCKPEVVLGQFKNPKRYRDFVFDQADYQRRLERIKHLLLE